jgi:hypothetical protein
MPAPIPVVSAIEDRDDPPVGGTLALSGSSSQALPGALYTWQLIEQPPGSSAYLTGSNTATPTLNAITARGTYIVFLKITDSGGSSHQYPYPTQSALPPYGFSTPLASAFGVLRIREESGLVKAGRGEYGWFEKGLWPLVDRLGQGLAFEFYDVDTHTLTADAVVPFTDTELDLNSLIVVEGGDATYVSSTKGAIKLSGAITVQNPHNLEIEGGTLLTNSIEPYIGDEIAVGAPLRLERIYVDMISPKTEASQVLFTDPIRVASIMSPVNGAVNVASQGTLVLSSTGTGSDITISSADDIAMTAGGTDGDIVIAAGGNSGNISVTAANGVAISATGTSSQVALNSSGVNGTIQLNPALNTQSTKPVFAPGLVYEQTYTRNGNGALTSDPFVFTRQDVGSECHVDGLLRILMPKHGVAQFSLVMDASGTLTTLGLFSNASYATTPDLFMHLKSSIRVVSTTKLVVHTMCYISNDAGGIHATEHSFKTITVSSPIFNCYFVIGGDTNTNYDLHGTAALFNAHSQQVI